MHMYFEVHTVCESLSEIFALLLTYYFKIKGILRPPNYTLKDKLEKARKADFPWVFSKAVVCTGILYGCISMHWVRSHYSRARRPRPPRSFFLRDPDTNTMAVSSLAFQKNSTDKSPSLILVGKFSFQKVIVDGESAWQVVIRGSSYLNSKSKHSIAHDAVVLSYTWTVIYWLQSFFVQATKDEIHLRGEDPSSARSTPSERAFRSRQYSLGVCCEKHLEHLEWPEAFLRYL